MNENLKYHFITVSFDNAKLDSGTWGTLCDLVNDLLFERMVWFLSGLQLENIYRK